MIGLILAAFVHRWRVDLRGLVELVALGLCRRDLGPCRRVLSGVAAGLARGDRRGGFAGHAPAKEKGRGLLIPGPAFAFGSVTTR